MEWLGAGVCPTSDLRRPLGTCNKVWPLLLFSASTRIRGHMVHDGRMEGGGGRGLAYAYHHVLPFGMDEPLDSQAES